MWIRAIATPFWLLTSSLLLTASPSVARDDPGERWQHRNDRGNRYEGRREIPVSRPDFELISFLGYQEDYEQDVELRVRFFLPEGESETTIHARELRDEKQYWMASKPADWRAGAWNVFGPWPTREVLEPEGIAAWDFGLFVEVGSGQKIRLAPSVLYHSAVPDEIGTYSLVLRPNWSLKRLEYSVTRVDEEDEVILEGRNFKEARVGEPILLDLETGALPPATWLRLEVVGSIKGRTDKAIFEMVFFHQSSLR